MSMSDKSEATSIAEGLLKYLEVNDKKYLLPQVLAILSKANPGNKEIATVYSLSELSEKQQQRVRKILEEKYGVVDTEFEIDETLVGGLKIVLGDEVLDLSFKQKLDQLIYDK